MVKNILTTIVFLVAGFFVFEFSHIDLAIQDEFFNFNTAGWLVDRRSPIPRILLYDVVKVLYGLLIVGLIVTLCCFKNTKFATGKSRGMIIVLTSLILIPLAVNFLKATTNVACPRDLARYGGAYPYVSVLESYPVTFSQKRPAKCYPAGHASGGFALLSLFFLLSGPRGRTISICFGLTIGWTLGLYKMVIGDHFLSHTIMTMMLAWLIILLVDYVVPNRKSGDPA